MTAGVSRALLDAWERGLERPPHARAAALLAATDPGDDDALAHISLGRRDARLLDLRARAIGDRVEGVATCAECGEDMELEFDLDDVRASPPESPALALARAGYDVEFRLPDGADVAAAARRGELGAARAELLRRCVTGARRDGRDVAATELPEEVAVAVADAMAAADPQADVELATECPACGAPARVPFDVAAFVWAEVDARARRVLRDVHTLASAYGWREDDILSLGPARRALYLEMAGG
ncbi:MAG TPA: phage baseplate protein [Actinomycetota bacterium]|nr:phage baseplate protein [Actinomycetota bacterium]